MNVVTTHSSSSHRQHNDYHNVDRASRSTRHTTHSGSSRHRQRTVALDLKTSSCGIQERHSNHSSSHHHHHNKHKSTSSRDDHVMKMLLAQVENLHRSHAKKSTTKSSHHHHHHNKHHHHHHKSRRSHHDDESHNKNKRSIKKESKENTSPTAEIHHEDHSESSYLSRDTLVSTTGSTSAARDDAVMKMFLEQVKHLHRSHGGGKSKSSSKKSKKSHKNHHHTDKHGKRSKPSSNGKRGATLSSHKQRHSANLREQVSSIADESHSSTGYEASESSTWTEATRVVEVKQETVETPPPLRPLLPCRLLSHEDPYTGVHYNVMELETGIIVRWRGSEETSLYVEHDQLRFTQCLACEMELCCIPTVNYVLCPECHYASPLCTDFNHHNLGTEEEERPSPVDNEHQNGQPQQQELEDYYHEGDPHSGGISLGVDLGLLQRRYQRVVEDERLEMFQHQFWDEDEEQYYCDDSVLGYENMIINVATPQTCP